ncbi:MAG: D-lactate dehydrogenase [Proteobacteria bacterium]|nr:D-lactate dehydrogenase [Pseudomonadota bacterium]
MTDLDADGADLVKSLREALGRRCVLTTPRATRRFRQGFRGLAGDAVAVVVPITLVQMWRALVICCDWGAVVVFQAANTGLTGGSTPPPRKSGQRLCVVVCTLRLRTIHLVDEGRQAICLPGATLHGLEQALRPLGREPHSVIGSTCLGASVVGGICNNSGGALVRRGPAYTEMALFAQVDPDGRPHLCNALGVDLGNDPEEMLLRLENGDFAHGASAGIASDPDYHHHVRDVTATTPARFNADPRRLHDASGSAGRLAVFAVRSDTFPVDVDPVTFCCGTNRGEDLTALRRALLTRSAPLPISAEYVHADALDAADRYGRDLFHAIRTLGTDRIPALFSLKARVDAIAADFGIAQASERVLQHVAKVLPSIFTPRLRAQRRSFAHHLILKVSAADAGGTNDLISAVLEPNGGAFFVCEPDEAKAAALHRYVTAGAANRMHACHPQRYGHLVAFDVALPRNAEDWDERLPSPLARDIALALRYGHFACHVFHRDYLLHPHADPAAFKARMMQWLDAQGAEYPAEHNVGRQYRAKPSLEAFYRALDPTNSLNPGIGQTAGGRDWADDALLGERK